MPWQQNDEDGTRVGLMSPKFLRDTAIGGVLWVEPPLPDKRCTLIAAVTILDPIVVHLVATPRHPKFLA